MSRRNPEDRAADLEARAAKLRAESERRLSVASDGACALMWDAEKALRALGSYLGRDDGAAFRADADELALVREARWTALKGRMER